MDVAGTGPAADPDVNEDVTLGPVVDDRLLNGEYGTKLEDRGPDSDTAVDWLVVGPRIGDVVGIGPTADPDDPEAVPIGPTADPVALLVG